MGSLTKKTFTTSRTFTYTYYHYRSVASTPKPTLLLCHGWPDSAELWAGVVPKLLETGHPILIPDCLGYAGTSKPTDYKEYSLKAMSHDMFEILDHEAIDRIISIGHDWGSALAQRVCLYGPQRCSGLVLLDVAYLPPSDASWDFETINKAAEQKIGYPAFAYWDVFAADDGPALLLDNVEMLFHVIHWDHPEAMKIFFATAGNTRKMLQTGKPADHPLKLYAQAPGFKEAFIERMKRDGFEGPQCWYKSMARNVNRENERVFSDQEKMVKVPCLYISGTEDWVCRTDGMEAVRPLVPDLTQEVLQANHWITFEKPEEVGRIMASWLKERF